MKPCLAGTRFSLIFYQNFIRNRPFWGPGWPGIDFHWFSLKFLLETDHFGALAGRGWFSSIFYQIFIRKRSFWGPGWLVLDFHRFSIKFLLEATILEPWLAGSWFSLIFCYICCDILGAAGEDPSRCCHPRESLILPSGFNTRVVLIGLIKNT